MKFVTNIASSFIFEKEPLSISVTGDSMHPFFQNSQHIDIRSVSQPILKNGKCYVYLFNGFLIVHRLLWQSKKHAYFAGDANNFIEKIELKNIIGEPVLNDHIHLQTIITLVNYFFLIFLKIPAIFKTRSILLKRIIRNGV